MPRVGDGIGSPGRAARALAQQVAVCAEMTWQACHRLRQILDHRRPPGARSDWGADSLTAPDPAVMPAQAVAP